MLKKLVMTMMPNLWGFCPNSAINASWTFLEFGHAPDSPVKLIMHPIIIGHICSEWPDSEQEIRLSEVHPKWM